jgi:tape measure domain-containing protein
MSEVRASIRVNAITDAAKAALREVLALFDAARAAGARSAPVLPGVPEGAKRAADALTSVERAARGASTAAAAPVGDVLPGVPAGAERAARAADAASDSFRSLHETTGRLRNERGQFMAGADESLRRTQASAESLRGTLASLAGLGAMTAMAREAMTLSDAWSGLTARMATATGTAKANADTMAAAKRVAAEYGAPLADIGNLYVKVTNAVKPLGGGLKEVNVLAEAMAAALKKDGTSAENAAEAIRQYGQALEGGKLQAEEMNTLVDSSPSLLTALASGLDVARGELKKMAEEGKLTTAVMTQALAKGLPQLRADAKAAGDTIGGGFTAINSALLEYVGKGMQTSGVSQALASGLRAVADNIGPVVQGVTALTGLALAAALGRGAAAAVTLATSAGTLGTALSGMLALLGGPVGLVVMVGALAAAWVGLSRAKQQAATRTLEDMQAERAAVQAKQDELKAAAAKGHVGFNAQAQKNALDADASRLDAEIQAKQREREAKLRADAGPRGGGSSAADEPVGAGLRETAKLTEFLDKYKGVEQLRRAHGEKMKEMEVAFGKEIAAAQSAGDAAKVAQLKGDFAQAQALAQKELNDKVKGMSKPDGSVVTRLASYKAEFDAVSTLRQDGIKRDLDENQRALDEKTRSSRDYFARRADLEDEAVDLTIAKLRKEIAAREQVLKTNEGRLAQRRKGGDANSVNEAEDAVRGNRDDLAKARGQLDEATRDKASKSEARASAERRITEELERQRQAIELQIRDANGLLTAEDLRARIAAQYAQQRKQEQAETGATKRTDALIDAQARIAQLGQLRAKYGELAQAVKIQEDAIQLEVERGVITTTEGERRKMAARQQALPALQALVDKSRELAQTEGERNSVAALGNDVGKLKNQTTELEATIKSSGQSAFGGFFRDVIGGAKSAKDAFREMVDGFAQSMLDLAAKKMGEKLMNSLFDGAGAAGGGGGGGWIQAAASWVGSFFHQGGIVGGHTNVARNIHPATWNYAPRYHTGGIAGLKPDEVPAILQRGEEVLTRDDPRHSGNAAGIGGVNISVNVSGAEGGAGRMSSAGQQLAELCKQTVNQWAITQSRPGGILFKG